MNANEKTIREFIAAWSNLDADELVSYFTEDGVYYNMPIAPVKGAGALKQFIAGFIKDWSSTEWEILNILADGETVVAERMDRTKIGDTPINLPCFGIFEMEAGKIKVWRDYFDMATYVNAASSKS